jgi:hypothetical protein
MTQVFMKRSANAYPDKEVGQPSKTTIHRLVTKYRDPGMSVASAHRGTKQLKSRPYQLQATYQLPQRNIAATIQDCYWFRLFVLEGVLYVVFRVRFK